MGFKGPRTMGVAFCPPRVGNDGAAVDETDTGSEPEAEPASVGATSPDGSASFDALPTFQLYHAVTIGEPPWATLTMRQPVTWPPAIGYPVRRLFLVEALPVTL